MTAADQLLQKLDSYVEYKIREMALRMHLVHANELRERQLHERLLETRAELLEVLDNIEMTRPGEAGKSPRKVSAVGGAA